MAWIRYGQFIRVPLANRPTPHHTGRMKSAALLITMGLLLVSVKTLAEPALSADKVLAKAEAQAAAQHKAIFLRFDASW